MSFIDINEATILAPDVTELQYNKLYPKFKTYFKRRIPQRYNYRLIFEHFFLLVKRKSFYKALYNFFILVDKSKYHYLAALRDSLRKDQIKNVPPSQKLYVIGYERAGYGFTEVLSPVNKLIRSPPSNKTEPLSGYTHYGYGEGPGDDFHYQLVDFPKLKKPFVSAHPNVSQHQFLLTEPPGIVNELFIDNHLDVRRDTSTLYEEFYKYPYNLDISKEANKLARRKFYEECLLTLPQDQDFDPYRLWLKDFLNGVNRLPSFEWLRKINAKRSSGKKLLQL